MISEPPPPQPNKQIKQNKNWRGKLFFLRSASRSACARPVPRVDPGGGFVNWGGGGRHRRNVDVEASGGMYTSFSRIFFFINLIEYGVSFCILK